MILVAHPVGRATCHPIYHIILHVLVTPSEVMDNQPMHERSLLVRAGHSDLERAYQLSQEFEMMLAEHREADLDAWLISSDQQSSPASTITLRQGSIVKKST